MILSFIKIFGSLALLLGVLFAIRKLGERYDWHAEIQRKIIHTGLGLFTLSFVVLFSQAWEVAVLCSLTIALLTAIRTIPKLKDSLGGGLHAVDRFSFGEILFALSIALIFYLSKGQEVLYILPILILTLADAAAALVGVMYAKTSFQVEEGTKSWEGTAFFFLTSWLLCMVVLLLLTNIAGPEVILIAFILSVFGALLEATSWKGLDNLFVPMGLFLLLRNTLEMNAMTLLIDSVIFGALVMFSLLFARKYTCSLHAMLTVATALFFFWIVGGWANILGPLAVFGAHLYLNAQKETSPDELVVVLSIISAALVWYTIAVVTYYEVYYVFNLALALHFAFILMIGLQIKDFANLILVVIGAWMIINVHFVFMADLTVLQGLIRSAAGLGVLTLSAITLQKNYHLFEYRRWVKQAVACLAISALGVPFSLWF